MVDKWERKIFSGTEEFELFRDAWNLYKNNALVEDNAEYFEKVIQDTEEFYQKYKTPFAKELGIAIMNEIERKYKHEYKMQS